MHLAEREAYHSGTDRSFGVEIGKPQRLARKGLGKVFHLVNDPSATYAWLSHGGTKGVHHDGY